MEVVVDQIRERFPSPVADLHYCTDDPCTHYCVLGAVLSTLTGENYQFPEPMDLVEYLKLDDDDDPTVVEMWLLALAVMQENDACKFEEAWSRAEQLLALLRARGLV
jgi:hypothetical protein